MREGRRRARSSAARGRPPGERRARPKPFRRDERPSPFALAAGNGGAALIGVILPGRFDDAMRVAVVRRYPGCRAGVGVLCLSLVMLGLIDSVALAPLALAAAVLPGVSPGMRVGLAVVAAAG